MSMEECMQMCLSVNSCVLVYCTLSILFKERLFKSQKVGCYVLFGLERFWDDE